MDFTFGGAANRYDGDHFGEVIWAEFAANSAIRDRYYDNRGLKDDFNSFLKGNLQLSKKLTAYIDVQYRQVDYRWGDSTLESSGIDADQRFIQGDQVYNFINPKAGLTLQLNDKSALYASFAVGNREPVRSDFIDAPEGVVPEHETLLNWELGYRVRGKKLNIQANAYFMDYTNQLVATGELNDVGATVRTNVADSYRAGIELDGHYSLTKKLHLAANLALSDNRIADFNETVYQSFSDGSSGIRINEFTNTPISFSPGVVGGATLAWQPIKGGEIAFINKYVGRQYLDNTGDEGRSLDPFYVAQLRTGYTWKPAWAKEIVLSLQVNNLFDARFSPNGYTYNYEFDGTLTVENFLYPQAGRHVMGSVGISF
jgi:iron complex outermembrane receptor protein